MKATSVLRLPITEASAKIRDAGVLDDAEDMDFGAWAGVQPLSIVAGEPVPDEQVLPGIELPAYLRSYQRPQR
jgi:hypothetical protein